MRGPEDEIAPLRQSAEAEVVGRYEAHRGLLVRLLTRKFGVPPDDAESLAYETIMACEMVESVPDVEAWLIAGACEKGKAYQQAAPRAVDVASARDAVALLPERAREAVRLRFEEGKTYPEIAAELGISLHAAQRMVAKAVGKIRTLQRLRGR